MFKHFCSKIQLLNDHVLVITKVYVMRKYCTGKKIHSVAACSLTFILWVYMLKSKEYYIEIFERNAIRN